MLGSPYYFIPCYSLCVVKERVMRFYKPHEIVYKIIALSGGDNRDRTGNLQLAKLALSQLSYVPGISW